jgi:hypothetical protein
VFFSCVFVSLQSYQKMWQVLLLYVGDPDVEVNTRRINALTNYWGCRVLSQSWSDYSALLVYKRSWLQMPHRWGLTVRALSWSLCWVVSWFKYKSRTWSMWTCGTWNRKGSKCGTSLSKWWTIDQAISAERINHWRIGQKGFWYTTSVCILCLQHPWQ